jgi:lipoprotein-releasing system permease protein
MSRLPFELFLALRYLRPKRTYVSVITLISVIGVMLGVAVLIIVISVMSGFDKQLRDKILGFNAHLRVTRIDSPMAGWQALLGEVEKNPNVRGASPYVMMQVMVETQPQVGNPMQAAPWVRGIEPQYETNVSLLHTNIIAGDFDFSRHGVIVGSGFAQNMRLRVGDRLSIYSPAMLKRMKETFEKKSEEAVLPMDFQVRGIFDVGYYDFDANVLVVSLEDAQDLFELDNDVHGLMVMIKDPYQADKVRQELLASLGSGYRVSTWMSENSYILNALMVEKNVMFYLLFFIMIVAAFGITSSLITFVVQKTREIGVLKALGATRLQVIWLFLSQSVFVGVLGVTIGFGLGMLALHYRNEFLHVMNKLTGMELFPAQIYSFTELPALIMPMDIVIICGSALLICVFAGLIPAWTAGRLNPVEALRHE